MNSKCILSVLFLFAFFTLMAQVNLTDTWELYNNGDPPGGGIYMNISHTSNDLTAVGPDWKGTGKFNPGDNTGYYNWEFTDGKTGITRFTFYPEYDRIDGYVSGSGISWGFFGRRNEKALADFNGSYSINIRSSFDIIMLRQTANTVEMFFKIDSYHLYGSGFVIGNFAMIEYNSISEFATTLTVSGTGKIYLFISNDRQNLFLRSYQLTPRWAGPNGGIFKRNRTNPEFSPAPGWIGADGKQNCVQSGSSGFRLSCQSPDDFEESSYCMDPRTIQLIDYWLSNARPFPNWDGAWYDCWGRWVGTSRDGKTVARGNCHRPDTGGKTRCEYVLEQLRNQYPYVDKSVFGLTMDMTLEKYLYRKLKN